jgi:tetratricopeptide (TPR) repeat protein
MSEQDDERAQALGLWHEGYRLQMAGDLDAAITAYRRSLAVLPTAEAHTFLGWAMSFQGRLAEAIEECHRAIAVDPDFGNPYNDIGVYLMQQEKLDEAIPWLERAKEASRYEPRHFPYMNLGRVYVKQGKWWEALRELETAVRVAPRDAGAHHALHELRGRMN